MFTLHQKEQSTVAVLDDNDYRMTSVQDALDLLGAVTPLETNKLVLYGHQLPDNFFQLSSGVAGEILQKYTTYHLLVAIVEDTRSYNSSSLQDFVRESNRGTTTFFYPTLEEALEKLHHL